MIEWPTGSGDLLGGIKKHWAELLKLGLLLAAAALLTTTIARHLDDAAAIFDHQ